jgi:hypothetical protein
MWTRRKLIGAALAGGALMSLETAQAATQQPSGGNRSPDDTAWRTCCDTCGDCAKACNRAFQHCLTQAAQGKAQYVRAAQITADSAEFCALSSEMLSRNSSLAMVSCGACADACKRCAQDCESFDTDLDMKMCVQECKRCEESCRKMVKTA